MDISVQLDQRAPLEYRQLRYVSGQGLPADHETDIGVQHENLLIIRLSVERLAQSSNDQSMLQLGCRHDADFTVYHFLNGLADLGHAEPLFVGNGLRTGKAGHAVFILSNLTPAAACP